jgi:hypothetical protein
MCEGVVCGGSRCLYKRDEAFLLERNGKSFGRVSLEASDSESRALQNPW